MHSFIIKTTSLNLALKHIKKKLNLKKIINHPDILIIKSSPSISIKTIRHLKSWINHKPFQIQFKVALIHQAQLMTQPAQNALLKTLEEPPQNTYLFLTTPNSSLLLETITSRCHLINPKIKTKFANQNQPLLQLLTKISQSTPGQRLAMAGNYGSSPASAIQFCQNLIPLTKKIINTNPHALKHTLIALKRLQNNLNPRLTLESLFLNL